MEHFVLFEHTRSLLVLADWCWSLGTCSLAAGPCFQSLCVHISHTIIVVVLHSYEPLPRSQLLAGRAAPHTALLARALLPTLRDGQDATLGGTVLTPPVLPLEKLQV